MVPDRSPLTGVSYLLTRAEEQEITIALIQDCYLKHPIIKPVIFPGSPSVFSLQVSRAYSWCGFPFSSTAPFCCRGFGSKTIRWPFQKISIWNEVWGALCQTSGCPHFVPNLKAFGRYFYYKLLLFPYLRNRFP